MPDDALTCEHCGTLLSDGNPRPRETGVRAIRQGRLGALPPVLPDTPRDDIPEYGDYDMSPVPLTPERSPRRKVAQTGLSSFASRPTTRRGVPVNPRGRSLGVGSRQTKTHQVKRHAVNWMLLGILGVLVAVLAVGGYFLYMRTTDDGQRITARKVVSEANETLLALCVTTEESLTLEKEEALKTIASAPHQAYWLVGQEYMDKGDVETAILSFRIADILNPENYDGLLLLANAYELGANDPAAEAIYQKLIDGVAPSRSEAYTALLRMLRDQQRDPEAADLMLKAYENTDRENFRLERKEFIPLTPQVDLPAGRYELAQTVHLTSLQGYDIYYTLDDGVELPVLGKLTKDWKYTQDGALSIPEGTLTLRALCVSEDLVSDPLAVTYTVFYPTPSAPYANLAPNTYNKPLSVSLRPGSKEDEKEHKVTPLTFYYTIDGSIPNEDSPIFDGTPIALPSGRVELRAVCVNKYGKMSSTREVGYKFDYKPAPLKIYSEEDTFSNFVLGQTTQEAFKASEGAPKSESPTRYQGLEDEALHLEYDWGYAVFGFVGGKWVLVRVEMNQQIASAPRGVGFGSSEKDITSVYKDMGQLPGKSGNRGLYYDDPNIGKVIQNADGAKTVQYSCKTLENKIWVLQYHLESDRVVKIIHYYQP